MKRGIRTSLLATLALGLLAACSAPPERSEGPPPGGVGGTSGSLATLVIDGRTVAFLPVGDELLAIGLEDGDTLSTLGVRAQGYSLSFEADACAADPVALKVVCIGYGSSKVAIAHVRTDPFALILEEIDLENTTEARFSGGSCLNCGVLTDPGDDRFIVASGDGYRILDYEGNLLASYLDAASFRFVAENFGYDYRENRILLPEYAGLLGTEQRLWVIDLDEHRAYVWDRRMTEVLGVPGNFLADAAAIDHETGLLVIGHEWSPGLLLVDLKGATWSEDGTFTAEAAYQPLTEVFTNMDWLTTGLAVESQSHLAFFEEEFGNAIGVARLPGEPGRPEVLDYTSAALGGLGHPDIPSPCQSWNNVGDPHGLAVFTTPGAGRPTGLVLNASQTCLAVVDLEKLLDAPRAPRSHRVRDDYDLAAEGVVRYLAFRSSP